jgi:hypothetical protein
VAIATIRIKFKIFPIPKYARIKKIVKEIEAIKPLREPAKTRENVKRRVANKIIKNNKTAPKEAGSTK